MNNRKRMTGWSGRLVAGVAAGLGGLVIVGTALAASSSFSWTMRWRYVGGKDNGKLHVLDAGNLTINGKIWITDKLRGSTSTPLDIQIEVLKENETDNAVCTATVVPSKVMSEEKAFSKSCGRIAGGKYWLRITKVGAQDGDGDAWHNKGSGTLDVAE
jgi:hypothetical protein